MLNGANPSECELKSDREFALKDFRSQRDTLLQRLHFVSLRKTCSGDGVFVLPGFALANFPGRPGHGDSLLLRPSLDVPERQAAVNALRKQTLFHPLDHLNRLLRLIESLQFHGHFQSAVDCLDECGVFDDPLGELQL